MLYLVTDKNGFQKLQHVDDITKAFEDQIRKQEKDIKEMKAKNK